MNPRAALALLFLLLVFASAYGAQKEPHSFLQSQCAYCHASDPGGAMKKPATGMVIMTSRQFHPDVFTDGYMHPYNVKPRKAIVPADMPLSPNGDLTCTTCHNVHASYFTSFGTLSHYLWRNEPGKQFCEICHREGIANSSHQSALGEAHFKSNAKYIVTDPSQDIDPMSKNCISCHDGSYSTSATIKVGIWSHGTDFVKFDMGSHPIGVNYELARASNNRTTLKPIGMVDPRIQFYNGKVGCGSCHNPFSTIEKQLIMSDRQSALCFSCHFQEANQ